MMAPAVRLVTCLRCSTALYQTDGQRVLCPDGQMARRPVVVTIGYRRLLFCSSECTALWIGERPTDEFLTGYPLEF